MHATSLERMREMRRFVARGSRVLDVGGADVNGSYRELFTDCTYTTLDFERADIIVEGYDWPVADAAFDAVISGQMLEHDRFFWLTLKNIARVLKPGGVFLLIVPAEWPIHRYPVDCYRFLPDSLDAMAEWAGLELVEGRLVLPDLCGAFRKPKPAPARE